MVRAMKKWGGKDPCVWMSARVVDRKFCMNFHDCYTCRYDQAMIRKVSRKESVSSSGSKPWPQRMRQRTGLQRQCRHAMTGRSPWRLCPYNYECFRCSFDQHLDESLEVAIPPAPVKVGLVEGYAVAFDRAYHGGHAWFHREEGGCVRVGLDDFAYRAVGVPDEFVLPGLGEHLSLSETGFVLKKGSKRAQVLSPVTGVVKAVNVDLRRRPQLAKESPYEEGWVLVMEPEDPAGDLKRLVHGDEQVAAWIQEDHHSLMGLVSRLPTCPDGGIVDDLLDRCPELSWEAVRRVVFKT